MKIGDLARRSDLSVDTIRYYERIGLLPTAMRDGARQRQYDVSILAWIEFLGRLKATGMPIRDMVRYAELRAQGDATAGERRELLARHRARVRAHVDDLLACLTVLDSKIAGYAGAGSEEPSDDADRSHDADDEPIHRGR
ncbi:MerR family transcriptional regulator [Ancylobacter sp. Lp-2]|uniref:MerR family transcriptional regulator n=1 Tax=Ancylobacter sp. Lp-2 TaxID=2881339 RepID=UPI001E2CD169|nr:MerR family transcriptional regulator [Ancylobacter sp. Lp-2]MCB4770607.1 MerR family transcriptional regulator [Ancylobacter sp. Lp-2]